MVCRTSFGPWVWLGREEREPHVSHDSRPFRVEDDLGFTRFDPGIITISMGVPTVGHTLRGGGTHTASLLWFRQVGQRLGVCGDLRPGQQTTKGDGETLPELQFRHHGLLD
jgi:hypothetical protein